MKKTINAAAQSVTFTFEGTLEPVTLAMSQVSPANATYAMLHGFAARIGDNAAITKSADNAFTVTEAMRRAAVVEMVEHYTSGSTEWNLKQSARKPTFNASIQRIAEKRSCTYEEAQAWFNAKLMAELDGE